MNDANSQLSTLGSQLPLNPTVAELIPFTHHADWLALPEIERERVKELINVFTTVKNNPNVVSALRAIARSNANRRGWSFCNLRSLYYGWLSTNCDWRSLARAYKHEGSLPEKFIAHLRTLTLKEHRSRKQAIEKIRTAWQEGKDMPGYGTWREWFATRWPDRDVPRAFAGDYPEGWSNSNLYLYMPPPAQQALATGGFAAAHGDIPHVIRDTSKLRPLEMIVADDFRCDTYCIYQRRVVRTLGIKLMDVATRRKLAVGFKPLLTDDEGVKRSITRADLQFLLKQVFMRFGVPADYPMTILVENAAAAISNDLEAALEMFFHGQVRVSRTNMLEHRTLANGFTERGGKPWEKGWIESDFNLMHNLAASLPGQMGASYDLTPATTIARVAYCEQLLGDKLALTDGQVAQLQLPIGSFDELQTAYEKVFDLIDNRTEHKLLGFDTVNEWCQGAGDAWKPMQQIVTLPREAQLSVEVRERKESPMERWNKLMTRCSLVPVPEFFVALLAFTPKRVAISNRKVTFVHGGTGFTYLDTDGCLAKLPESTKLLGYFDENAPGKLYLTDLKGRAVGILKHNAPADIKNPDAISESAALVKEFFHKQVQGPVRELLAADDAAQAAATAHNDARLAEFRPELPAPRKTLSAQLADDTVTTTPTERFSGATNAAASIAQAVQQQTDEARRRISPRKPKHDLDALAQPEAEAAGSDADLSKLI